MAGPGGAAAAGPRRTYARHRLHGVENAVTTALTRAGLIPHSWVLTTVGRRTGRERHNPVTLVEVAGRRWLVAPYGPVPWVLNTRAAGEVRLTRRAATQRFRVREVGADEAGPVLKAYARTARATRPYFGAGLDDPPEAFAREAHLHPVFELLPATA